MQVRAKKLQPAHKMRGGEPTPKPKAQFHTFPAPVMGIDRVTSRAMPQPGTAWVLDNYICTQTGIRARGGATKFATVASSSAVVSVFPYRAPAGNLFAATAADIFDITTPADADTIPVADVSGLTSGDFSTQQFTTGGGSYLYAVNGADYAQIFDGTNWNPVAGEALYTVSYDALSADFEVGETLTGGTSGATAEILGINKTSATAGTLKLGAITSGPYQDNEDLTSAGGAATAASASASGSTIAITGVATTALNFVWSFGARLWFVEEGTWSAWYLSADTIGGAATELSLAGIFRRGGSLMFGGSWSTDAGDGLGDKCLFVSTEGEVVIYQGTDPASDWTMVGLYDIGRPVGKNAVTRAGGDFLIATELGIIPMSRALQLDVAALSTNSVTSKIEPLWFEGVKARTSDDWSIMRHDQKGYMVVATPDVVDDTGHCFVANMRTGAWTQIKGWDVQCMAELGGVGYFGTSDGLVMTMETAGSDNGSSYTCSYVGQFEALAPGTVQKMAGNVRATFSASSPYDAKVSILTDYDTTLPSPPSSPTNYSEDVWDSGLWDVMVWDAGYTPTVAARWTAASGVGHVFAPGVQLTFGVTPVPKVDLVAVDLTYSMGAMVT